MTAVWKKELRAFRTGMPAYVFTAFLLAAVGMYFSYNNLNLASPRFESVLKSIHFVFLIFVPLLTMRSLAEERKGRTDQLLHTLPLQSWEVVLGKYLALVSLYAVPMVLVACCPLILRQYGRINEPVAYCSILGFFLLGCAYLALGLFASSLTENPVIAAVLCFGFLLFSYSLDTLGKMIPYSSLGSVLSFAVLLGAMALLFFALTKQTGGTLAWLLLGGGALFFLYHFHRPWLEGRFQNFLSVFYLNGKMDGFYDGLLDIPAIFYYCCVILLSLFVTTQAVGRRTLGDQAKKGAGFYGLTMTLILAAGAILAGQILQDLPGAVITPDLSQAGLYTLTSVTEDFLATLSQHITIYQICAGGQEDAMVTRLLERYQDQSPYLSFRQVDPVYYPAFVSSYSKDRLSNNSIIVAAGTRSKVIPAEDLYLIGSSSMTGRRIETAFLGEGLVTSAIASVVTDRNPIFYLLRANGEPDLPEVFQEEALKNNMELRDLNLLVQDGVPEDADALLLLPPAHDYSQETADKILSYLEKGGRALMVSDFSLEEKPNLDRILEDYGLYREEGIVLEGDPGAFLSYPYCIIPTVLYSQVTADVYRDSYLLLPMAQAVKVSSSLRSSISMEPLLMSSQKSYNKKNVQNMTTSEQEAADESGPFILGMEVREDINQDGQADTCLLYFSTGYLLDEDYNQTVSGGNARLFGGIVRELQGEEGPLVSVPAKNMQPTILTITDQAANFWTGLCVFVIPALFLLTGGVIWARRRNR